MFVVSRARLATRGMPLLCRFASGVPRGATNNDSVPPQAPAPPAKAALVASAIIDAKIGELMVQLEQEDSYMGPITVSQRTSDVEFGSPSHTRPDLDRLRVVPRMMAFYMANPALEEALRTLRAMADKYTDLPVIPLSEYERPSWIDPSTLYGETKDGLSQTEKECFYTLLDQLNRIEPQLQTPQLRSLLYEMKDKNGVERIVGAGVGAAGKLQSVVAALLRKSLDSLGRSTTIGRRKTASARVYMARARSEEDPGQILVNGRSLEQYFPTVMQRQELLYPLKVANAFAKYNVFATVQGGGQTSQATAIGLGIAKGLSVHNPLLISRLREADCLTTDPRKKERKKPGKAKARKAYGWIKR